MPDITKCTNHDCPNKEACWRFTAPSSEFINRSRIGLGLLIVKDF